MNSVSAPADRVDVVWLHPDDDICVAARPLEKGERIRVGEREITLCDAAPLGHKIAIRPLTKDQLVRKYGSVIGAAKDRIAVGAHVHTHNLANGDFARDFAACSEIPEPPEPIENRTFDGYRRADGRAGTRNYIAVISTVNCSASVARYVADHFPPERLSDYPNIDGVVSLRHHGGCAMEFGGLKHAMLNRVMGGMAKHPNIGGYLLIGLGCEQGAMGYLVEQERLIQIDGHGQRQGPPMLSMQDLGGTRKTVEEGVKRLTELLPRANDVRREPIPASEIVLGAECGGSDGNSGITANPAVGVASDLLVACGGTSILAETPEIFGAEHLLTRRARTPEVAEKLLERIRWWVEYARMHGVELDNNPSIGNKEGGLTTICEKSLGAVAKGGRAALEAVYEYAEPVDRKGFVVMDTPGFDPPSVTGMVAGGANVVVFTTGRGSCYGCKPTPSIKIASNTPMYQRMEDDMDINAGTVLQGRTVEQVGREIFEEILAVASGKPTKSEALGIGDDEFVPWDVGPTL